MSAASVQAPLTTDHIQSPYRFSSPKDARRAQQQLLASTPPNQWQRTRPLEQQQQQQQQQRQHSPPAATHSSHAQRNSPSPTRVNPNSRTSAGFPLAPTASQKAEAAQRRLDERLEWEDRHQAAVEEARAAEAAASDAKELARLQSEAASSNKAAARAAQEALYKRQLRDPKIPYHERIVPPRPDFPEDPLTAFASEHTGRYPGPIVQQQQQYEGAASFQRDDEPIAPEGSAARAEQRRRTNPLLDSLYIGKSDAAGLGYGRKHRAHFRYISSNDAARSTVDGLGSAAAAAAAAAVASSSQAALSGYKSKDGRGYRPEVRALGWGAPHGDTYNQYVSVRRADDVLKDYPNKEACQKFLHRKW